MGPYDNIDFYQSRNMFRYGSINIERAYIEWNQLSYATVRFGRYLTPFGIWSQDHGAPILTSIRAPAIVNYPFPDMGMPQWQTGIEILGRFVISGADSQQSYSSHQD